MFYTTKNNLLTGTYIGNASVFISEDPEIKIHEGEPKGFDPSSRPDHGFMWNVKTKTWVDCRPEEIRKSAQMDAVLEKRRKAYPSLSQFADAMYWSTRGKPELLEAYFAQCDEVKSLFPKPEE